MNQRWLGRSGSVFLALSLSLAGSGCGSGNSPSPAPMDGGSTDADTAAPVDKATTMDTAVEQSSVIDTPVETPPQAALVVAPANLTIPEGGMPGSFTVSLSQLVTHAVVVTISTSDGTVAKPETETLTFDPNTNAPKTVMVDGIVDDDTVDNNAILTLSADGITSALVRVVVTNTNVQTVVVPPTATMTETQTANLSVRLKFRPAAPMTVSIASTDTTRLTVSPATLTFSPTDYSIEQMVTLTALKDADNVNNVVRLNFSTPNVTTVPVDVTIIDIDKQNLLIDGLPASLSVKEDDTNGISFYVHLSQPPTGNVTVTLSSSDTGKANVSPATIMFNSQNFNTDQSVLITPVHDTDTMDDPVTITLTPTADDNEAIDKQMFTLTVKDVDSQQIVVLYDPASAEISEGGDLTLSVHLSAKPAAQVNVTVFAADPDRLTVTPSVLTFDESNFGKNQMVIVHANHDNDVVENDVTLTLKAPGATDVSKTVKIDDIDKQAILLTYTGEPGPFPGVETAAGAVLKNTGTVSAQLQFQPGSDVTVSVVSDDSTRCVLLDSSGKVANSVSLTFTKDNYNMPQFLTFQLPNDTDGVNNTVHVTFSSPGIESKVLTVNITDVDVQNFKIVRLPDAVMEPMCKVATPPDMTPPDCSGTTAVTFDLTTVLPVVGSITATITSGDTGRVTVDGGSQTITLTSPTPKDPATPVTIHLSAHHDADSMPNSVTITIADTATTGQVQSQTVTINIIDSDTMNFLVAKTGPLDPQDMSRLVVNEAELTPGDKTNQAIFHVSLTADPVVNTAVSVTPSLSIVTVNPTTLNFTGGPAGNYSTGFDVTVQGIKDVNLVDELLSIQIAGPGSLGAPPAFVFVRQKDIDVQAIYLSTTGKPLDLMNPDPMNTIIPKQLALGPDCNPISNPSDCITEGTNRTFYVSLKWQPASSVTLNVTVPPTLAGSFALTGPGTMGQQVAATTLTFSTSNYFTPQAVSLYAVSDPNTDNETVDVVVELPGQDSRTVHATSVDTDHQEVLIDTTGFTLNENNFGVSDGSDTKPVQVKLKFPPHGGGLTTETIDIAESTPLKVGVSPGALTFGNFKGLGGWDTYQSVQVAAKPDDDSADESTTLTFTSRNLSGQPWSVPDVTNGKTPLSVPVKVNDQDRLTLIITNPAASSVNESGDSSTTTVTVQLASGSTTPKGVSPLGIVTVSAMSNDIHHATVTPSSLTLTNNTTPKSFTITGVADDTNDNNHTVTITLTASSSVSRDKLSDPPTPFTVEVDAVISPANDGGVDGGDGSDGSVDGEGGETGSGGSGSGGASGSGGSGGAGGSGGSTGAGGS